MYRFVMNIPKDILKNLKKINKVNNAKITNNFYNPKISLKDQFNIAYFIDINFIWYQDI